jgi:predicted FMN-binding regulatory protein PaiB
LSEDVYSKILDATMVYKLEIQQLQAKFKFGQHLSKERFEMIIEHLYTREDKRDSGTIEAMKELRNDF